MLALRSLRPWPWNGGSIFVRRNPAYGLQPGVDHLFDEFFKESGRFGLRPFGESLSTFKPRLDVSESDEEIKITAELPGLDENDIDLSLAHDVLTISGEKKAEKEDRGENYYHVERSYGSFKRSIALPAEVEADQIEALFKNGLLTITLPKTAEVQAQVKKIEVKAS